MPSYVRAHAMSLLTVKRRALARPTRFQLVTSAFGGQRSIQLSYGRFPVSIAQWHRSGNGAFKVTDVARDLQRQRSQVRILSGAPSMQAMPECADFVPAGTMIASAPDEGEKYEDFKMGCLQNGFAISVAPLFDVAERGSAAPICTSRWHWSPAVNNVKA